MTALNEPMVTWDVDGWAEISGWALAHFADSVTTEYLWSKDVWVSVGTSLPAGAYLDAPPASEDNKAIIRQAHGWAAVADYRGVTVYDKDTRQPFEITTLDPLPETHTMLPPSSPHDVWDGSEWKRDEAAAEKAALEEAQSEQARRISVASKQIAIIKPAVDGGYAKPEHAKLLTDWQRYRYELTAVPELNGWPSAPMWPEEPDRVV